mmetsp:Transcript_94041/g.269564  ORF Transcript_94041/g.269564 Transcript_94041/m.269564 type:complete len:212 (-) Transcript_94041:44-679(-)
MSGRRRNLRSAASSRSAGAPPDSNPAPRSARRAAGRREAEPPPRQPFEALVQAALPPPGRPPCWPAVAAAAPEVVVAAMAAMATLGDTLHMPFPRLGCRACGKAATATATATARRQAAAQHWRRLVVATRRRRCRCRLGAQPRRPPSTPGTATASRRMNRPGPWPRRWRSAPTVRACWHGRRRGRASRRPPREAAVSVALDRMGNMLSDIR